MDIKTSAKIESAQGFTESANPNVIILPIERVFLLSSLPSLPSLPLPPSIPSPFHCSNHPLTLRAFSYFNTPAEVSTFSTLAFLPSNPFKASSKLLAYMKFLIILSSSSESSVKDCLIAILSFEYILGYLCRLPKENSSNVTVLPFARGIVSACELVIISSKLSSIGVSPA